MNEFEYNAFCDFLASLKVEVLDVYEPEFIDDEGDYKLFSCDFEGRVLSPEGTYANFVVTFSYESRLDEDGTPYFYCVEGNDLSKFEIVKARKLDGSYLSPKESDWLKHYFDFEHDVIFEGEEISVTKLIENTFKYTALEMEVAKRFAK